ncbi:aspartate aminotransferase family protein [Sphingobacterium sp.]|uniref:pyridoxal phosphate-dependent decarboxylase family protein n=1 Tax=Sphingobacterium sp. TaxID=341027 RepID=UPI00289F81A3|nr:aspartate aminotransferase family protein [Sphingobacterium sp.]
MDNSTLQVLAVDRLAPAIADQSLFNDIFSQHSSADYNDAINQAKELVITFLNRQKKPFSGITPSQLNQLFEQVDFDVPLSSYQELFHEVDELYVQHATAFHLPHYIAHLNCPVVIPALAAEVLVSAINSSQDTYDQSAGGTLMERRLIDWTAAQIGYPSDADGIFTAGGSQSNLMGLLLARDHFALNHYGHNIKQDGNPLAARRFRIFVSEKSHFSNQKNAALMGLGEQSIISVATDSRFRMRIDALQAAIEAEIALGNIPIAIVATAGTTDFGNIDPLNDVADLASQYGVWMHVDAAYGCGLLLTDNYRYLLNGIERAHSVTIDYHKSFFQPISGSAFIVRDKKLLQIIKHHADYLNPEDQDYEEYPAQINKSITQSTRRFDALKLWFTLRLMGREKLGEYIDTLIYRCKQAAEMVKLDPELELLSDSDISILLFRYAPAGLADEQRCAVNQQIKKQLFHSGQVLLASTKVNGRFYLKFTIFNPLASVEDIKDIFTKIKATGATYVQQPN